MIHACCLFGFILFLGAVHDAVRLPHIKIQLCSRSRLRQRITDADRHIVRIDGGFIIGFQIAADAVFKRLGCFRIIAFSDNNKFIPAVADRDKSLRRHKLHGLRQGPEGKIPVLMPVSIVNLLQAVHIHEHHQRQIPGFTVPAKKLIRFFRIPETVIEPRHGVFHTEQVQPLVQDAQHLPFIKNMNRKINVIDPVKIAVAFNQRQGIRGNTVPQAMALKMYR